MLPAVQVVAWSPSLLVSRGLILNCRVSGAGQGRLRRRDSDACAQFHVRDGDGPVPGLRSSPSR